MGVDLVRVGRPIRHLRRHCEFAGSGDIHNGLRCVGLAIWWLASLRADGRGAGATLKLPTGEEFETSGGYPACDLVVKQDGMKMDGRRASA